MSAALGRPSDRRLAAGLSLGLHALLLLVFGRVLLMAPPPAQMIFSVETVSGITPQGEGSGAPGSANRISNQAPNLNPLAGGLALSATDAPLPQAKPQPAKRIPRLKTVPQAALPPTQAELEQRYAGLKIGVQPREQRGGDTPSEGGMGNAHQAGVPGGPVGLEGAIAGRGYRPVDVSYDKPLPEESQVVLLVTVSAEGEVVEARVARTSGFPELDQHALSKAREFKFDALPPGVPQVNVNGNMTFSYEYSGHGSVR